MSIERHVNTEVTPWTGEHLHRYFEAQKYINSHDIVLDLACGSGYGCDILSKINGTIIYGGDIEADVISYCNKTWINNTSVHFERMNAVDLRFENAFFDKIISLETIEHLTAYEKMVAEFGRVIKPNGIVIISTPNIKVSSPGGIIINTYHTQEFTYDELKDILKAHFSDVTIFGQKYTRYFNHKHHVGMKGVEKLLLGRGIRKIPYSFRNNLFKKLFRSPLYPSPDDFRLFPDKKFIEDHCHVLFAVCKK